MSAPISVVIPTLNSADSLPTTLLSLIEGLEAGLICEVVVTDGGSTDASGSIALDWGALVITGAASRGGQLRRGVAVTRGAWVMVLHADTILQEGWAEQVKAHMQQGPLCFSLAFCSRGLAARWVEAWANFRSDVFGLPFGDQGLLLRRTEYDRAGGYPDQPLMEDVALVRAIKRKIRRLPACAFTAADKYQQQGWFRRGTKNIGLLLRYFLGADAKDLARRYHTI